MNLLKNSFAHSSLISKIILLIFVAFLGMIIAVAIVAGAEKLNWLDSQKSNYLLIAQAIAAILTFIVPAFIFAYLCSDNVSVFLFLKKKSNFFEIIAVIGILIIGLPFINLLSSLNESLSTIPVFDELFSAVEKSQNALAEQMLGANFWGAMAVVALMAAMAEEIMFRGAILRTLSEKMNVPAAVWLSAAIFSLIHFQFFGLVPRMVLGAYFAYIVIFSKNIRLSMWTHFFNNAAIIIVTHLSKNHTQTDFLNTFGGGSTWISGTISGIVATLGTIYLIKYWRK